jgi:hypothetical protein
VSLATEGSGREAAYVLDLGFWILDCFFPAIAIISQGNRVKTRLILIFGWIPAVYKIDELMEVIVARFTR